MLILTGLPSQVQHKSTEGLYFQGGKIVGAAQAKTRIANRVLHIEEQRRAAIAAGDKYQARKLAWRRQGAELALEGVAELLRNYKGQE